METIPSIFVKQLLTYLPERCPIIPRTGPRLNFDNREDFLFIPDVLSARRSFTQETALLVLGAGLFLLSLVTILYVTLSLNPLLSLTALVVFLNAGLVLFKLYVIGHAGRDSFTQHFFATPGERAKGIPLQPAGFDTLESRKGSGFTPISEAEVHSLAHSEHPTFTVFVPLLHEASVMKQIARSLLALDYPEEKLQILLTFEEDDEETIAAFRDQRLPPHFREIILPNCFPKSKPKALNVALLHATGDFFVIFDAEIIPNRDQLKRAVIAFQKRPDIACFQTRLEHYNAEENALTRLFNMEFACYYDFFLPGLQRLGLPIPLSGHSVYFRGSAVKAIGGWDPYNMAEDCDIGIRLFRNSYKTGMIDSVSEEEAVSDIERWVRQRTRWMKGFMQTSIVALRHPIELITELRGIRNYVSFLLLVPGTVFFNLTNFACWLFFALWLIYHPLFIKSLYPGPVLTVAVLAFAVGSLVFVYLNLIAAYNRGRYGFVKYGLLTPLYWMLLSYATARAVVQLSTMPHVWEKTSHGAVRGHENYEEKTVHAYVPALNQQKIQ